MWDFSEGMWTYSSHMKISDTLTFAYFCMKLSFFYFFLYLKILIIEPGHCLSFFILIFL